LSQGIIKIKDKYFVWSTVIDAPIKKGMTGDELKKYIKNEQGSEGIRELPERLKEVEKTGTSFFPDKSLRATIAFNRAGDNDEYLTEEEIYLKYSY